MLRCIALHRLQWSPTLIDPKRLTIAHPIVQQGSNITIILDELQSSFSPEDALSKKLSAFQNIRQAPGESNSLFAIRVTEGGQSVHPALTTSQIQDYLVTQFITGLIDSKFTLSVRPTITSTGSRISQAFTNL